MKWVRESGRVKTPAEDYDRINDFMPERPEVSCIIDHPRKLVIVNLCADPYRSEPEEIFTARTCYEGVALSDD